jgi:uncharacterized protein GlcG (DUF336 family)
MDEDFHSRRISGLIWSVKSAIRSGWLYLRTWRCRPEADCGRAFKSASGYRRFYRERHDMSTFGLDHAQQIIGGVFAKSRDMGLKPITVAVLDAGGHVIALAREDGSSNLRPAIALGKAGGALALGVSSRRIGEMAAERPSFIASVGAISPQGIIPAAGGVIVLDEDDRPIGAVGVTGDTSDNDEICALYGIAEARLRAAS